MLGRTLVMKSTCVRSAGLARLAALVLACGLLPAGVVRAQGGEAAGVLAFFEPARGTLSAANPSDEWALNGFAGQPVALVATGDGSLDPVLEVIGPDGALLAENDDMDSLVRDAGLEAFALPSDGAYTVRVRRYEGAGGATAGAYELIALPGFGEVVRRDTFSENETTWVAVGDGSVAPAQGYLRLRAPGSGGRVLAVPTDTLPLKDFYFQADTRLFGTPSYAEFGLVVRMPAQPGAARQGYTFKVNTAGQWSVVVADASGEFVLQSWRAAPSLEAQRWTLSVLVQDTTLSFYGNGALLGTVTDGRLTDAGTVGLMVATDPGQDDQATVLFDNVVITQRLGTTYRGLPLTLTEWANPDFRRVVAELAASGHVEPVPAHALYLNSRTLDAMDRLSRFEPIGSEQALYGDFMLGASVLISTDGESAGCGLLFRYQDERNLDLAYIDSSGGFGIVQAQDAALTTNVYDRIRLNETGPDRLLVIAQGERVTLYVNGALAAQETLAPSVGRVGLALLNYDDAVTHCLIGDIWVWPLAG